MEELDLEHDCTLMQYTADVQQKCAPFSCGNQDLDDFFRKDAFFYEEAMLGKSYCWVTNNKPHHIVALMTLANDSIKSVVLPPNSRNRFNRTFDNQKRNLTYPATLIGRLGVNILYQRRHVGKQMMDFIKRSSIASDNDNACRFLVVDAYNDDHTLSYYKANGFVFMHRTEDIERSALRRYDESGAIVFEIPPNETLNTRMMYFDLKKLS